MSAHAYLHTPSRQDAIPVEDFPTSLLAARSLFAEDRRVEGGPYFAQLVEDLPDEDPMAPGVNVLATWSFTCTQGELVLEVAAGFDTLHLEAGEVIQSATSALRVMADRGARELLLYPAEETVDTLFRHDGAYGGPLVSMAVGRHTGEEVAQAAKALGYNSVSMYM